MSKSIVCIQLRTYDGKSQLFTEHKTKETLLIIFSKKKVSDVLVCMYVYLNIFMKVDFEAESKNKSQE